MDVASRGLGPPLDILFYYMPEGGEGGGQLGSGDPKQSSHVGKMRVFVKMFLGSHERRFTCMEVQLWSKTEKPGFPHACFFIFFIIVGAYLNAFGILLAPSGASLVSLVCWCHPVGCLWLAWAACGLSLLILWCL